MIDRERLRVLMEREQRAFIERNPASRRAFESAGHLFGRVPLPLRR